MTTGTEADKPSDRTTAGNVISSGQFSAEMTMRSVLQMIAQHEGVENGVLRILSKEVRGHIGIQNGSRITGAYITSTREYGREALYQLLSATRGMYAFLSIAEQQAELKQSLTLTVFELLDWRPAETSDADQLPPLPEAVDALLAGIVTQPPTLALAANEQVESQLVQDTEEQFASYMSWGGEASSANRQTFGSILGNIRQTGGFTRQELEAAAAAQGQPFVQQQPPAAPQQQPQQQQPPAAPQQPPLAAPPPPPPAPWMPPPAPSAPQSTAAAPQAAQPQRSVPLPPQTPLMPGNTGGPAQPPQPTIPAQTITPPQANRAVPPPASIPFPGKEAGMPSPEKSGIHRLQPPPPPENPAGRPQPPMPNQPTILGQQGISEVRGSTANRWSTSELNSIPSPKTTAESGKPGEQQAPADGGARATTSNLRSMTAGQERPKPKPTVPVPTPPSTAQERAMDSRTSQRMKAMSTPDIEEDEVPAVREAKGIGKDVLIGGGIGVALALILANQSFQALSYTGHFSGGIDALKAGKNEPAVVEFSTSISANPYDGKSYFYRALAESRLGNSKDALADYEKAINYDPGNKLAKIGKASLYIKTKKYDSAILECNELLKQDDKFIDAYRIRAAAYNQSGQFDQAIADCNYYLDKHPAQDVQRADVLANRAYANYNKRAYDAALNDYSEALACEPDHASYYASRAVVYKSVGDWAKAVADSNKAIELTPGDTSLFKIRGMAYAGLGEAQKAEKDLDNLVKFHPSIENHRMRGNARLLVHDYQGAMADFDYVLGAKPHDQDARSKYEQARLGVQGSVKQTSVLADVISNTKHEPVNLNLPEPELVKRGYTLMLQGEAEDAEKYLTEAVRKKPNDTDARRYLAYTLIEAGANLEAASHFAALAKVAPLPPGDMLMYAKALQDGKKLPEAIKVFNNILSSDMTNDRARTSLINAYIENGEKNEAVRLSKEGMQTSPQKESYQDLLKKAEAMK